MVSRKSNYTCPLYCFFTLPEPLLIVLIKNCWTLFNPGEKELVECKQSDIEPSKL